MITKTTTLRVRYAETDKMQFVYNGKYLEYFEVGRAELLRQTGLSYCKLEEAGYQLPLIEAAIKFLKPAHYDEVLEIEACIEEINSAKVHVDYKIKNSNKEILVTGFTEHMFIKIDTKKPVKPPKIYTESLANYIN